MSTEKIGRYEIKEELGRGGMATVFRAYDPSFERDVAIKVLPREFSHDKHFRTRFEREAKMIGLLEHPAIVPVYDFGEENDQPYIVMRYMSGGSLTDRLLEGRMSIEATAQIIARLAPALDAAHAVQIVHRDLKPGNVLFDQYGHAFLSDFGIARFANRQSGSLTGTMVLGTPAYMSPEQVQGSREIDGRSDIYALGVLIYQMLTGDVPYKADTAAKVMVMHVLDPVPSINAARSDLPLGCEALIARAMAKEREKRFATAGELSQMLDAIARGEFVATSPHAAQVTAAQAAAPQTRPQQAQVFIQPTPPPQPPALEAAQPRHLAPWLAVGILACLLLAGIGGVIFWGLNGSGPLAGMSGNVREHTLTPTQTSGIALANAPANAPTQTPTNTAAPTFTDTPLPPPPTLTNVPPPEPSATLPPEPTPTPTNVPVFTLGGADKIAWLDQNDIWVANLDGSDLKQLTSDGATKSNLQWSPDGQSVHYLSGKCVQSVSLDRGRIDILVCFKYIDTLKAFEISPDGAQVAISLDNQLYVAPYDIQRLSAVETRSNLAEMAPCEGFGPYTRNFVKYARWSKDSKMLALVIFGVADEIGSADIVQVLPADQCPPGRPQDHFPPPRMDIPDYSNSPSIPNFGWDGVFLFSFNTFLRNKGFGDLYIYNMDLHKGQAINPIGNTCCYRDSIFSPDGEYLLFVYQAKERGSTAAFYMIPYGSIGTGTSYQPLPLPTVAAPDAQPQPALRRAIIP